MFWLFLFLACIDQDLYDERAEELGPPEDSGDVAEDDLGDADPDALTDED